jgi:hypothetical protein
MLIAILVVKQNVDRMALEGPHLPVIAASAQSVIR